MKLDRLNTLKLRLTQVRLCGFALCRFKRKLSVFKRLEFCVLYVLLSASSALPATPLDLGGRDNALGTATPFGHARIVRPLGELTIGGMSVPIDLVFNSNPADAPGAFGPYWRIPLFASTVVQFNQYKLYWDGPHERRQFFVLDRTSDARRSEKIFIERGKDWKATVGRRGEILIEALDDSGWTFRYDNGQLTVFQLGDSVDACRITYSGRGLPLYITNEASNRRIFEIEYRGATDPERIIIGEQQIEVEMGDAELTAPDGATNYRNFRVSFLRSLAFDQEKVEHFTYSKADSKKRTVSVMDEAEKKVTKALDLAVNRMETSSDTASEGSDNWIEWEAASGFITADSGGTYKVKNDAWDPNIQEDTFDVTPSAVEMVRLPTEGKEQRWSYHWNSGVRVFTDLATGEVIRRTVIMSEGPANGKLRKREVLNDDGAWTLDRLNSYDPKGRIVRAVHGEDMRMMEWEDSPAGSTATEYLNGRLVQLTVYGSTGDFVEREIFKADGDVDRYVYGETADGRSIAHYLNGEAVSYKELDPQGRLSYMKWADGKEQFWDRSQGAERFLTLFPDGREYLVERLHDGAGFSEVTAPELVANAVDYLTQTRK